VVSRPAPMKRIVAAALTVSAAAAGLTCGGSTGREDLPSATATDDATTPALTEGGTDAVEAELAADAGVLDGAAGLDATTADDSLYTGAFDVMIQYADRVLPDVQAGPGGMEAGPAFPDCPPFIPVGRSGAPLPLGNESDQIPAAYGSDGGLIIAPDGSTCATYPWLGSVAVDRCVTAGSAGGLGTMDFAFLPPCNWAEEAGVAAQGPSRGTPKYDLCMDLYECFLRTQCYLHTYAPHGVEWCFCGVGTSASDQECQLHPQGACLAEEMAALEQSGDPAASAIQILINFETVNNSAPGWAGRYLNWLFGDPLWGQAGPGGLVCRILALQAADGGSNAPGP
jgi:hypothetical protein